MRYRILMAALSVLVVTAAYLNIAVSVEYFGAGEPYFGRSRNMDKWINPLPLLGMLDAAVVAAVLIVAKMTRRPSDKGVL